MPQPPMLLPLLLLLCAAHCTPYSHRCLWREQAAQTTRRLATGRSSSARTGPKTVARWTGAPSGETFEFDEEEVAFGGEREGEEEEEDGDNYGNDDDDNDRQQSKRTASSATDPPIEGGGLLQWAKTLYEGIFFYGLDEPPADSGSRGARMKRRALEDMATGKRKGKSTFFTVSEQVAQSLLAEGPEEARKAPGAGEKRRGDAQKSAAKRPSSSSSSSSSSPSSSAAAAGAAAEDDAERELALLDAKLALLSRELQLLDKRLAEPSPGNSDPAFAQLRERVLNEIEEVQIAYVTVKAEGLL